MIIGDCLDFEAEDYLPRQDTNEIYRKETEQEVFEGQTGDPIYEEVKTGQSPGLPVKQWDISPKFNEARRFQFGAKSGSISSNQRSSVTGGRGQLLFGVSDQSNIKQHVRNFNTQKSSVIAPKKNPFKRNTYVNFNSDTKSIEEEPLENIQILQKP